LICLDSNYSKFELPNRVGLNHIKIGFEISDVLKIDDKDYAITFSLYFSVEWVEPRLRLAPHLWDLQNSTATDLVPVNLELINSLWVPNIFIYNLKTFQVIDVLSKLAGLWIDRNQRVYYSQATHITFICPMLFDSFPLDTQICKFQVGSYSYDMHRMVFNVSTLGYIQRTQALILDYRILIRNLSHKDKMFNGGALGNYSLAGFEMILERHVMSYIITYYLPSGLFVVVSWISFLIPPDIVPGRMALLITLFLVLINIFNNVTTNSPKAEGLTAIEIWMLACILFVFGALVEYAIILYWKQRNHHRPTPSCSTNFYTDEENNQSQESLGPDREVVEANEKVERFSFCTNEGFETANFESTNGTTAESCVMLSCKGVGGGVRVVCKKRRGEEKEENGRHPKKEDQKKRRPGRERKWVRRKSEFSTWRDEYASTDRFFLFFSPVLFLVFNLLYWVYFRVWELWANCQEELPVL